jgi:hypothetical protein
MGKVGAYVMLLLEALLLDVYDTCLVSLDEPGLQDDLGFVVDSFPRTATQERVDNMQCICTQLPASV